MVGWSHPGRNNCLDAVLNLSQWRVSQKTPIKSYVSPKESVRKKGKCCKLQQTCHEIQGAPSRVTGSRNQWNNWPMESEGIRRVEQIWAFDLFERIINYRPGAGRKMATNLFDCEDEARLLNEVIHCCRMPDVWPLGQL